MLKTKPYISEKVWGYEQWLLSTLTNGSSQVITTEKGDTCYENLSTVVGDNFPLLIKLIQANDTLSVQVHPNDEYAMKNENSPGKTECWYILDAKPDATLVCGMKKVYSSEEIKNAISNNTLDDMVRYVPVKKGDFIFIPSGTVHAIQGGIRILEVQQPSDITYRLYDWGRPREMHIEKGVAVIHEEEVQNPQTFSGFFSCPYFALEQVTCDSKTSLCLDSFIDKANTPAGKRGYGLVFFIAGAAIVTDEKGNTLSVSAEDSLVLGKDEQITIEPTSTECSFIKIC